MIAPLKTLIATVISEQLVLNLNSAFNFHGLLGLVEYEVLKNLPLYNSWNCTTKNVKL